MFEISPQFSSKKLKDFALGAAITATILHGLQPKLSHDMQLVVRSVLYCESTRKKRL